MTSKVILSAGGLCSRHPRLIASRSTTSRETSFIRGQLTSRFNGGLQQREVKQSPVHATMLDAPEMDERLKWYEKNLEFWQTIHSKEELDEILQNEQEKMVFLDLYAGFCGSCKAAYPALSRVAGNPDFQKDFLFLKGDVTSEGIREFVRSNGIRGIPTVMMFAPGGKFLVSFGASFRKINSVKANLVVMAANKGAEFVVDPNGYVVPRPSSPSSD